MTGLPWLALIAAIWWAALLNPAQAQSFSTGLHGVDLPAAVVSTDWRLSIESSEGRRQDSARGGSFPAAPGSPISIELSLQPAQWYGSSSHQPAARPSRSPAQPRAPPTRTF